VLNDLRAPSTAAQNIDLLMFYKGGDDFEYQVPGVLREGGSIFTPQSDTTETIVSAGIAETAIKPCTTAHSELSIGEHFLSIKQFLNKNSQLQPIVAQTYASNSFSIFPWYASGLTNVPTVGTLRTPAFNADMFSFLAPMYNYYRGKARIALITGTTNNIQMSNVPLLFRFNSVVDFFALGLSYLGQNATVAPAQNIGHVPTQTPVTTGTNNGFGFLQSPWQARYPVAFTQVWTGGTTDFYQFDATQPLAVASFVTDSNFGTSTTIQRSFCDDFQLSFFIGCPAVYVSTA